MFTKPEARACVDTAAVDSNFTDVASQFGFTTTCITHFNCFGDVNTHMR